ncbi:MAG TPA: hypothetical protein VLM37_02445, partial [Fibrobacteraceae bacterium]|nr:hypothetical protein [Fibrobacteraceae bacterium]
HGEAQWWGSDGVLEETAVFRNGLREGISRRWYKERMRRDEAHYTHNRLDGKRLEFYPSGEKQAEEFWKDGMPIGVWRRWHPNEKLALLDGCHTDQDTGSRTVFSETGIALVFEQCRKGILDGAHLEKYTSGTNKLLGAYRQGKPDAHWTWWRADGSLWREEQFRDGLRDGEQRQYNLKGTLSRSFFFQSGTGRVHIPCPAPDTLLTCAETTWVAGRRDGRTTDLDRKQQRVTWRWWHQDSLLREQVWRLDAAGSPLYLALEGCYVANKRSGLWRTWFRNGQLKDSLFYRKGELYGLQQYFDSTGHLYMAKRHQGIKNQVIVEKLDPKPILLFSKPIPSANGKNGSRE